jgi:hypothetical protein
MKGLCRLFYSAACFGVNEGFAKLVPANGLVFHKTGCVPARYAATPLPMDSPTR